MPHKSPPKLRLICSFLLSIVLKWGRFTAILEQPKCLQIAPRRTPKPRVWTGQDSVSIRRFAPQLRQNPVLSLYVQDCLRSSDSPVWGRGSPSPGPTPQLVRTLLTLRLPSFVPQEGRTTSEECCGG